MTIRKCKRIENNRKHILIHDHPDGSYFHQLVDHNMRDEKGISCKQSTRQLLLIFLDGRFEIK